MEKVCWDILIASICLNENGAKLPSSTAASKHGLETTSNNGIAADATEFEAKRPRME
ncbi:hypothetical protein SNOG_09820 [Parastagonospora nodorum SN15]|uniref:Uncharacterized protein n=1 Tax=Phaeosphaeria nodorum (strain SN15 / ATCC MYA-4574 / FGSC 10173) TaxID=321614 RepID=Q0UEJ4_PHANO|nr:hypothetical protein SNOG_09820 [Parastagonospora nodorum SN15]EAT83085.1 hypothetical protein SNOG_09820 [Parastagonospora nodorum SN15]